MLKENERIKSLLEKLDAAEDDCEIRALGHALLKEDPASPYGKLAVWQTLDEEEGADSLYLLREALEEIRALVESREQPAFIDDDRDAQVYCAVLMNLGTSLFAQGEATEALELAKELANFDDEGVYNSRQLLYGSLLVLDRYDEILSTLESDPLESVIGEHARAIALIELDNGREEIMDAVNYAVALSPDVPFLVLGIWDFPEADDEQDEDIVVDAAYLVEPWSKSDKRLTMLSLPAFMLGYLTERIDDSKEIETLLQTYEYSGVLEDVQDARAAIAAMIKRGDGPDDVDAAAMGETEFVLRRMLNGLGDDALPF